MRVKRYILFVFIVLSAGSCCFAQGQWIWMNGDNTSNAPNVYGTILVEDPANKPGARYEACEWTDNEGNFWLLGGGLSAGSGFDDTKNDLWKYDPKTDIWTWMNGDNIPGQPGVYGTKGVPSPGNKPGARGYGANTWTDKDGNLWLYGGYTTDINGVVGAGDDLWKYDPNPLSPTYNQWAWMHGDNVGDQPGSYGTKKVPSSTNVPLSRSESASSWTDDDNNLWLFGGFTTGSLFRGSNDLWKYNISTNEWTWMSGDNIFGVTPVLGTKGVESATSKPGASLGSWCGWKAPGDSALWLNGGGLIGGMWRYNIKNDRWAWMAGKVGSFGGTDGNYGTQCVPAPTNLPFSRAENRARWTDDCGNFWMFGGSGYNDLWRYNRKSNMWVWVIGSGGDSYGTKGVAASTNMPKARQGHISWRYGTEFWMFGGMVTGGEANDLWKYIPDKPVADFTFTTNSLCVLFTDSTDPGCNEVKSYLWNFGDTASGASNISALKNPSHTFSSSNTYDVKLLVTNCTGSKDSITKTLAVAGIKPDAGPDVVIAKGAVATLAASGGNYTYSWFPSTAINCNTCQTVFVNPTATTIYVVDFTDSFGCKSQDSVQVTVLGEPKIEIPNVFTPNGDGFNDAFTIKASGIDNLNCSIYNRWGIKVNELKSADESWNGSSKSGEPLTDGVYYYFLKAEGLSGEVIEKKGFVELIRNSK